MPSITINIATQYLYVYGELHFLYTYRPIYIASNIHFDLDRNSNKFGQGHPGIIIKTPNTTKTVKSSNYTH